MSDTIRITAPHFVAGLIPHNGRVVNAAPILRYMIHWDGKRVAAYCKQKGWKWERVQSPTDGTSRPTTKGQDPRPSREGFEQ